MTQREAMKQLWSIVNDRGLTQTLEDLATVCDEQAEFAQEQNCLDRADYWHRAAILLAKTATTNDKA